MTEFNDVHVEGDGTQNAFGNMVSGNLIQAQLQFVRGRPSMSMSESEIAERVAGYVPVSNHDQIVATLDRHHAIALAGESGSGATTAAVAALRQLRPGLPVRLFSTDEHDVEEIGARGALSYLVRAGDEEPSRLRACLEAVRAAGGFLLVVGTAVRHPDFGEFLPVLPVDPPLAEAVYQARLVRRGLGHTDWMRWTRAAELLKDATPGDARRLADLVLPGADEHEVELAYRGWDEQLRDWFQTNGELRDRTLMIAAATITPADETSVYGAALSLARQLKDRVEGGGLAWCPSTGLSERLGADRDEEERLVFRRHGYAESVLHHVWDEYPLTRLDLLAWLSALPTDDVIELRPELRRRLVEVFAHLAAEHGAADRIVRMASEWAARHQAADLAYVALARTCLHPNVGGRVRQRLYEWSVQRRTAQMLKLTIARVCQVLGQTHPSIALTRLKHLGTYGDDQVQEEVFEVVRALAVVHPEEVFRTLLTWGRTAANLSSRRDMFGRARVTLRLLVVEQNRPVPGRPAAESRAMAADPGRLRAVLQVMGELAIHGDDQVRALVLAAARTLAATGYGPYVLRVALAWAANTEERPPMDARRWAAAGTEIFLMLAAGRTPDGLPVILTGPEAADPMACVPPWSMALTVQAEPGPGGFAGFPEALGAWLDAATTWPALRVRVGPMLALAAGNDHGRRTIALHFVRRWAASGSGRPGFRARRMVKEDVLVRLLYPEWKRLLLVAWVRLRSLAGGRR